MAISGYTSRGKVDVNWWMEQVRAGVEFRKKYAYESSWNKWRKAYRGNWGREGFSNSKNPKVPKKKD